MAQAISDSKLDDLFGEANKYGPLDKPTGVKSIMDPVVKVPYKTATRKIQKKPIQPVPKEHFGIYAASEAEIHLENYCAEHGNGSSEQLLWSECPGCDGRFFARDDYLCRGCRATL